MSFKVNPEEWTSVEMFTFLREMKIISNDEEFEDWKHDRSDMLQMIRDYEDYETEPNEPAL